MSDSSLKASPSDRLQLLFVTHFGFILVGIVTILPGPLLPLLAAKWSLTDAEASTFFVAQCSGSLLGATVMSRLIKRLGFLRTLALGYALLVVGLVGLTRSSWSAGLAAISLFSMGIGVIIPVTNLLVSELSVKRQAAALNVLNLFWGIGAVASQLFVNYFAFKQNISALLFTLALIAAALGLWFLRPSTAVVSQRVESELSVPAPIWTTAFALLTGAFVFFCVGVESSLSGWIASYSKRLSGGVGNIWIPVNSIFWAAVLTGRAASPALLTRLTEKALLLSGIVVLLSGILLLLATPNFTVMAFGTALAGLGTATIYPTTIARFTKHFGAQATRKAGPLFFMAALGSAVVTWLVGYISTASASLRTGLLLTALCAALMLALQLTLNSRRVESDTPR